MNNRGQLVFTGIMIAMLVFTMVVALIPSIRGEVVTAREGLDCSAANLTAMQSGTCIVTDGFLFFFVGTALAVGLGYVGARRLGFIGGGS